MNPNPILVVAGPVASDRMYEARHVAHTIGPNVEVRMSDLTEPFWLRNLHFPPKAVIVVGFSGSRKDCETLKSFVTSGPLLRIEVSGKDPFMFPMPKFIAVCDNATGMLGLELDDAFLLANTAVAAAKLNAAQAERQIGAILNRLEVDQECLVHDLRMNTIETTGIDSTGPRITRNVTIHVKPWPIPSRFPE